MIFLVLLIIMIIIFFTGLLLSRSIDENGREMEKYRIRQRK